MRRRFYGSAKWGVLNRDIVQPELWPGSISTATWLIPSATDNWPATITTATTLAADCGSASEKRSATRLGDTT